MVQQSLYFDNPIRRFELKINGYEHAYERAFNLYGILLMPALLGGVLMYNVFELRQEYFMVSFLLMAVILLNLYFFYERIIHTSNTIKLILLDNNIQIMDHNQSYFQEHIDNLEIDIILCGRNLIPALCIKSKDNEKMIIGLKNIKIDHTIETQNQLCQPDYWLHSQQQADLLIDALFSKY